MKISYLLIIFLLITGCSINIGDEGINIKNKEDVLKIDNKGVKINISGDNEEIKNAIIEKGINIIKEKEISKNENNIINSSSLEEDVKSKEDSKKSCEDNYNDLFAKYNKNYSDCYFEKPKVDSCNGDNSKKGKVNLVIIFDASGSMGSKIDGETMMSIAKDKVVDYISNIDSETNLSFVLYGHKGSGKIDGREESCNGVEEIYSFSDKNLNKLEKQISDFKPNGYTPIAKSLLKAQKLLKKQAKDNDKNIILLISDGEETCGGNPIIEAFKISKMKNTFIDVIGFNVNGKTQKQLMNIAKKGKGNYFDVKSRLDFEDTFNKTKNFLNTMSCGASKAAVELSYGVEAIDKYYSCMYRLKEEQIFMIADANENCKHFFEDKLDSRFDLYEDKFEKILDKGESILDNFGGIIEEVEDKLDD